MKFIIRAMAIFSLSTLVFGNPTFVVTPVLENENDDPIEITDIEEIFVRCSTTQGAPYPMRFANGTNPRIDASSLEPGTYFCIARVRDTEGRNSANSEEINFTIPLEACQGDQCNPKAPGLAVEL